MRSEGVCISSMGFSFGLFLQIGLALSLDLLSICALFFLSAQDPKNSNPRRMMLRKNLEDSRVLTYGRLHTLPISGLQFAPLSCLVL